MWNKGLEQSVAFVGIVPVSETASLLWKTSRASSQVAGSRLPFVTTTVCRFLPSTRLWRLTDPKLVFLSQISREPQYRDLQLNTAAVPLITIWPQPTALHKRNGTILSKSLNFKSSTI